MEFSLLERAIIFATQAHVGTCRRDGHTPYILHCTETAAIVATMTDDPEVLAAAVLHDVVEDTEVTADDLLVAFNQRISNLVVAMSENKCPDEAPEDTWLIRKEETIDTLVNTQDIALKQLFLGDKLSNLRGIYRDYLRDGDDIWEGFHQKSRAKQSWYYFRLESALASLSDTDAFREFHRIRQEIFER